MIKLADVGFDGVKFQLFKIENCSPKTLGRVRYIEIEKNGTTPDFICPLLN